MADDVELKDFYVLIYRFFSNIVHTNVRSSAYYIIKDNNITRFIIVITEHLIRQGIAANCALILRILEQVNNIFQIGYDVIIQNAMIKYSKIFER